MVNQQQDKWAKFRGIMSAIVTPMHDNEDINTTALAMLVEHQITRGVEGFYCCGSSGEGPLLHLDERKQVLETIITSSKGRVPVISHIGAPRTQDAIELAKHAESVGASAVSLVPPYYYKYSNEAIIRYYQRILDETSLPVILYNIPQFTGVELDLETAKTLFSNEQTLGVKHTSHNLYTLERMVDKHPEKVFFNGFDEIFLSSLAAGTTATVGTTVNIQPELFLAVRHCFAKGDFFTAQKLQHQINDVVETMVNNGIFQSTKYLAGLGLDYLGPVREPFIPLNVQQKQALDGLNSRLQEYIHAARALI